VNVLEAGKRQIGQNLAAQTASADNQNLGLISQKVFYLDAGEGIEILKQESRTPSPARNAGSVRGPGVSKT
jgi:hypothetical protein